MRHAKNRRATIKGTPVIVRTGFEGEGEVVQVWTIDPHEHESRGEKIGEAYSEREATAKIRARAIAEAKTRL